MHKRISALLIVLFLFDGTIMQQILPSIRGSQVYMAPHLDLLFIMLMAIFGYRNSAIFYGLGFGFLQDLIYYGHALGVYSLAYGLVAYLTGLIVMRHVNVLAALFIIFVGNLSYEMLIYSIYHSFLKVVGTPFSWAFNHQMLPSLWVNLLLVMVFYIPVRKFLDRPDFERDKEEV